ncbi:Yeti [Drosophila busckii]|uniref:Craniofacial development protein 1 n=1 Tax=Drosophila busckii TaxID=30019 RepID=A0A0M3QV13_DROBS|nr:craniofacial development protein 1 [Drosophila busckii]ALC41583.1 Yeti [Drosophila busckii]
MSKEQDYASDSDESDEDFCLENEKEADSGDEEEESDSEHDSDNEEAPKLTKKKDLKTEPESSKRSTRQTEAKENGREAAEKDELESDEEAEKSRSDALWADFLGDVGTVSKPVAKPMEKIEAVKPKESPKSAKLEKKPAVADTKTEILDFAGEQVVVARPLNGSSSSAKENQKQSSVSPKTFGTAKRTANAPPALGLDSLLNQLGKKKKMSVLEKSQHDWKSFKSEEGIEEELRTHNMGKDGFLERQDFLQRTDLRQFEIEKNMRQSRRQN